MSTIPISYTLRICCWTCVQFVSNAYVYRWRKRDLSNRTQTRTSMNETEVVSNPVQLRVGNCTDITQTFCVTYMRWCAACPCSICRWGSAELSRNKHVMPHMCVCVCVFAHFYSVRSVRSPAWNTNYFASQRLVANGFAFFILSYLARI